MMIENGDVRIRKFQYGDDDFALMEKWLRDPEVLHYYEGLDSNFNREKIIEKYGPRALDESTVKAGIVEFQKTPIGYLQYYLLDEKAKREWKIPELDVTYGIDLFIGETRFWNRGIGAAIVKNLLQYLFQTWGAEKIIVDPQTWNTRAIRCYEKCGFKPVKVLPNHELHDGEWKDNLIMALSVKDIL